MRSRKLVRTTGSIRFFSAALAAALALAAATAGTGTSARAAVPTTAPVFTTPLTISNTYFPVVAGAVKVSRGSKSGVRGVDVEFQTDKTRDFVVNTKTVTCRLIEEMAFEEGKLIEISHNYFAQADDGTVYYFGETVDIYSAGQIVNHDGSWLVGGPVGNDPPETETAVTPTIFMPANPALGDQYRPEDRPSGAQERDTVRRVARTVKTAAGKFTGCIEVNEFNVPDNDTETKWYAPGVGVVKTMAKHEISTLDSATFVR